MHAHYQPAAAASRLVIALASRVQQDGRDEDTLLIVKCREQRAIRVDDPRLPAELPDIGGYEATEDPPMAESTRDGHQPSCSGALTWLGGLPDVLVR